MQTLIMCDHPAELQPASRNAATIQPRLAKISNQPKTKRCVEFNSLGCSF